MQFPDPISTLPYLSNYMFRVDSRQGTSRTVRLIDFDAGVFLVYGVSEYSRMGMEGDDSDTINYYDFEGGPFLMVGEQFYDIGRIAALLPTRTQGVPEQGIPSQTAVLVSVDYTNKKIYEEIRKWQKQNSGR